MNGKAKKFGLDLLKKLSQTANMTKPSEFCKDFPKLENLSEVEKI